MNAISHHIPDSLLAAYASGSLEHAYSLVVASHISMCMDCRASFEAHQMIGGALLEDMTSQTVSTDLKANVMAQLDAPAPQAPAYRRSGAFPAPVMQAVHGKPVKWKPVGMGVRQCILSSDPGGSARLLYIPPGRAVPDHSHDGLELTLVLQGSFSDETGTFGVGDLEVADDDLEHTPVADEGAPCICLAATSAPLRFSSLIPRLVQPFIKI